MRKEKFKFNPKENSKLNMNIKKLREQLKERRFSISMEMQRVTSQLKKENMSILMLFISKRQIPTKMDRSHTKNFKTSS